MFGIPELAYLDPNMLGPQIQAIAPWLAALLGASFAAIGFCWRSVWVFTCIAMKWVIQLRVCLFLLAVGMTGAMLWWSILSNNGDTVVEQLAVNSSMDARIGPSLGKAAIRTGEENAMAISTRQEHKVIVLGMDGLDPDLLDALLKAGDLPNFQKLSETGTYQHMATVTPPESPVVWSSFATGLAPSDHGIFDFIHRDPSNYSLDLSITHLDTVGYANLRGGRAFWERLSDAEFKVCVLFAPCDFPPKTVNGLVIAGMGVPDLKGLMGKYSIITSDPTWSDRQINGQVIGIARNTTSAIFELSGPRSSTKKLWERRAKNMTVEVELLRTIKGVTLRVQNQQTNLIPGEWSPWLKLAFTHQQANTIYGICRFYLGAITPELQLYCTPIQIDPSRPAYHFAFPQKSVRELVGNLGPFATLGLPLDTKAYEDGAIDAAGFLKQADSLIEENRRLLLYMLDHSDDDFVFAYFNTPDPVQHMFWEGFLKERLAQQGATSIPGPIRHSYQQMDKILGEVLTRIKSPSDAQVIVVSDHGFADFRRSVELNRVLADLGYLTLKSSRQRSGPLFQNVDWAKTRAYACGFTSIYVNLQEREQHGIVKLSERESLLANIQHDLASVMDPDTQLRPITTTTLHAYGDNVSYPDRSPDMVVGFAPGYRVSWITALGGVGDKAYEPNIRRWKGDHIINAAQVPGIFLTNRSSGVVPTNIRDVGSYVLSQFGIQAVEEPSTATR